MHSPKYNLFKQVSILIVLSLLILVTILYGIAITKVEGKSSDIFKQNISEQTEKDVQIIHSPYTPIELVVRTIPNQQVIPIPLDKQAKEAEWKSTVRKRMKSIKWGNPSVFNKSPKQLERCISAIDVQSQRLGIHPLITAALIERETNWRNKVFDKGNGHGYMQIDNRYFKKWITENNWKCPHQNIQFGLKLLKKYTNGSFNGDWKKGIAAYNAGPTGVKRALKKGKTADFATTKKNYSSDVINKAIAMGWDGKSFFTN